MRISDWSSDVCSSDLTDMRGQLLDSHENYQYLRGEMWPHYQRGGLPEALLFGLMAKESNGKVHATSRAGAAGPMPFMFATGKLFGLRVDAPGLGTRSTHNASAETSVPYLTQQRPQTDTRRRGTERVRT